MTTMIAWGEVRSEERHRCNKYWALVETTRPAAVAIQIRNNNISIHNINQFAVIVARRLRKNVYVRTPGENKNGIPGQGGQGERRWNKTGTC
jgi:hypothetical protein